MIEKRRVSSSYFNALLIGSRKLHYMARAVANIVQFSQQRKAISIDQCPPT